MLNNNNLKDLIAVTRQKFNLSESVIEKDYYVTKVIHALANTEDEYFRLVFAGGTCLAKAHKIVKRMSEDVDFKIQFKNSDKDLSKSQLLKSLKNFRSLINSKVLQLDFSIGQSSVRNEGKYSQIELNYSSTFSMNPSLRTHILLEFTLSDIRLSVETLSIKSLIEDALENIDIFEHMSIQCISTEETAIEKWVGLTRRVMAIERGYYPDDKTLVRHIYDLNAIKDANKISTNFYSLAKTIVNNDAKQFQNQYPEYVNDSIGEIRKSLNVLKNKSIWKIRYQEFIDSMVYDTISRQNYENAVNLLEDISEKVIFSINAPD